MKSILLSSLLVFSFFILPILINAESNGTSTIPTNASTGGSGSSYCTNWINAGCGISPCASDKMKQTQKCGYTNSYGYSSEWENSQCVANETCQSQGSSSAPTTNIMLKTIAVTSVSCTKISSGNNYDDEIDFTAQNVGTRDILAGELDATIDNSRIYTIVNPEPINTASLPAGTQKRFILIQSSHSDARTLKVSSPSNSVFAYLTCSEARLCPQVITPAKNPSTNECRNFATPCDVPSGWIKVSNCSEQAFLNACSGWVKTGCNKANYDSSIEQAFRIWQPNTDLNNLPNRQNKIDYLAGKCGCFDTEKCTGASLSIISSKATPSDFQLVVKNTGSVDLNNYTIIAVKADNSIYTNRQETSLPSGATSFISLFDITASACPLSKLRIAAGNCPIIIEMDNTTEKTKNICNWQSPASSGVIGSSGTAVSKPIIKEVDKTVLLDVLFGLEQVKIKLDGLKDSALTISEYYSGKNDTEKAGKWSEISNSFDGVINSIDGITAEIKQNKDNITADFIQKLKGEVAGVKADISATTDKILEVI